VVSAGTRNAVGHPARAARARLAAAGARIARTDRDGEIVLRWRAGGPWRIALPGSPRRVEAER
jgi:beta-lactamase superfamily II metal-dependent hydrolase